MPLPSAKKTCERVFDVSTHVSKNETWGTRDYLGHPPSVESSESQCCFGEGNWKTSRLSVVVPFDFHNISPQFGNEYDSDGKRETNGDGDELNFGH